MALETADLGALRDLIRAELAPLNNELKNQGLDIKEVKDDLKSVYTKELIDAKLKEIWTELAAQKVVANANTQAIGSFWARTFERVGVILTSGWALTNIIPHLFH